MSEIKIIHAPAQFEPFIIIDKPRHLPSAPLSDNDKNNALSYALELFPEINDVNGIKNIEKGLLHRIDTETRGLLLIATTQEFYDYMQIEQKNDRFLKHYTAFSEENKKNIDILGGFPVFNESLILHDNCTIESRFRNYGAGNTEVRPVTEFSGKAALKKSKNNKIYKTYVKHISKNENIYKIECEISKGYRHQVRCHLAWCGFPISGDKLYNSNFINYGNCDLKFFADKLTFTNPYKKAEEQFKLDFE